MFDQILFPVAQWVIETISDLGYPAVFILMVVESALIPLPSEITMPFAGSLVATGRFNIWMVSVAGGLGNLVGSWLAYFLGFFGQRALVEKVIRRYGKYLLVSEAEFRRAEDWFNRRGEIIVFVSRLLPAIRTYISLPAGLAKMDFKRFSYYTLVGSLIWSGLLALVGQKLGENWELIGPYFHRFNLVIGVIFIIGGLFLLHHYLQARQSSA